jgi:hypothetical protein
MAIVTDHLKALDVVKQFAEEATASVSKGDYQDAVYRAKMMLRVIETADVDCSMPNFGNDQFTISFDDIKVVDAADVTRYPHQ